MVIVIRNREVVHAYTLDGSIFFLLKLFFFEDVIRSCLYRSRRVLFLCSHIRIHVCDIVVHVDHFVIGTIGSRLLLCRSIDVIHNLHLIVYVDNLVGFAIFRRPGLKPTIFQLNFLNSTCCRFNFSYTLHAWDSFRDQELLLRREIVVELSLIAALPSTCHN